MAPQEQGTVTSRKFMLAVYAAQFFFGGWFVAHGLNQWLEFFPRPKGSSPIARDLIMAMNASGLFDLIKVMEVITGLLLLLNRLVPLAIILAFPIALSIAHLNLVSNPDPTSKIVGAVSIALLGLIAVGRLHRYLPMLAVNSGHPQAGGLGQLFSGGTQESGENLRPLSHLAAIILGVAAPIALTFWTTSAAGPRSDAHYAQVAAANATPLEVVRAFDLLAFDQRQPAEAVRRYMADNFVDHSQRVAGDRQSVLALLDSLDWSSGQGPQRTVKHMLADGAMVAVHYHLVREAGTPGYAAVDLFRVEGGKIAEHWEAVQPLEAESANRYGVF